jgi:glycosyltransferase involved in cell wall biosynthesis
VRIALIGPVPPRLGGATPGGVATHQVHLAAGLAAAGVFAPLLATNTRTPPSAPRAPDAEAPFPLYRMGRLSRARAQYLLAVGPRRLAWYALQVAFNRDDGSRRELLTSLLWYRRFLAQVRPDLIHVQHPLERSVYARRVLRLEGWRTPLVVTAHSLFGEHSESTIETVMAPNLRAADRVIAVSPRIADQAMQLGVQSKRLRVIRSGVDAEHFRPRRLPRDRAAARQRLGIGPEARLVLFVGNLEPRKQVDVLLRALASVREEVPSAALIVVGSGESAGVEDQTARLIHLTHYLGLEPPDAVRFVGHVEDEELLEYYAAADVFALPSSSEAQGIVALEAMACGLPVVASAVGGLLGTIEDGRTGFLVPPGEVPALAERLVALLVDDSLRQAIGTAARGAVEHEFSWPRATEATLEVYRDVLECPSA